MPLSDINPGGALTATNSNDAPLLEFRVKRSGTITPLGVVESIAHEPSGDLLKGRLAFLTNNGSTVTPQMLISEEGNVGIGTQDPQAKLHVEGNAMLKGPLKIGSDMSGGAALSVDGNATLKGKVNATSLHVEADATFKGPLTIHEAVTVPSLTVRGAAAIGESLSVGGDVVVAGKLKAASIESDEAKLAGDLSIRLEQLNDRINEQNERLSGLESLPRKEFLDFPPQLDGDWVGGTTSPHRFLRPLIPEDDSAVIASGSMPVRLPDLSRLHRFRCDRNINVVETLDADGSTIIEGLESKGFFGFFAGLLRRRLDDEEDEGEFVIGSDEDRAVEPGSTNISGEEEKAPNLGMELVENDLFEYSILAEVTFRPNSDIRSLAEGVAVLKSFQIDCIVG